MTDQPRYFRISEGSLPITNSTADQVQFLIGGISLSAQFSWFMLFRVFRYFQLTIISMQNLFAALHDTGYINALLCINSRKGTDTVIRFRKARFRSFQFNINHRKARSELFRLFLIRSHPIRIRKAKHSLQNECEYCPCLYERKQQTESPGTNSPQHALRIQEQSPVNTHVRQN